MTTELAVETGSSVDRDRRISSHTTPAHSIPAQATPAHITPARARPVLGVRPLPQTMPPALSWDNSAAVVDAPAQHPELPWQSTSDHHGLGAGGAVPERPGPVEIDLLPLDESESGQAEPEDPEQPDDETCGRADPQAWGTWLAQLIVEVIQGRRPAGQLSRWAEERVLATVLLRARQLRIQPSPGDRSRHDQNRRSPGPPAHALRGRNPDPAPDRRTSGPPGAYPAALGSVRVQRPSLGSVEVSAVIRGPRCSAMAFRLEGQGARWLCTAIDFGPQTPQPM